MAAQRLVPPTPFPVRVRRALGLARVLLLQFRIFLISTTCAFFISAMLLYNLYPLKEEPTHHHSFLGVAYDTLQMTFFQTPIPFVDDWRLVPVFFGLPILGLLVVCEGMVEIGHLLIQRRTYSKEWQEMVASTFDNHIVIAGMGNVGFRVMEHLRRYNESVVCIERDGESSFLPELEKYEVPCVIGDCKNVPLLKKANIAKAKAFLAVTNDDLSNIEAALTVRELNPNVRIVIRVFDQRLAQKVQKSFGIDCAFSASALSAPVFAQAALSSNLLASFEFAGTVVNAFQLTLEANSPLKDLHIDKVREQFEVTILMHERNGNLDWNPPPETSLLTGDKILIMADNKNVQMFFANEKEAPRSPV
jgi:voltage-gated potassium channel